MPQRYTIEFSIRAVDADGDTFGPEVEGLTMDWATTDLPKLADIMTDVAGAAERLLHKEDQPGNITPRRADDEQTTDHLDTIRRAKEQMAGLRRGMGLE